VGSAAPLDEIEGQLGRAPWTGFEIVASYAAGALERLTGQDFGFPKCGPGACSFGEGVKNARRWWNDHKQDWKQ